VSLASLREAFSWIESFTNLERSSALYSARTYQLDRMRFLVAECGNPQDSFRSVHLAGSKGKGSTAVLMAESLRREGLRTGLYTSPHVVSYLERIRVLPARPGSEPEGPGDELLLAQARRLRALVDALEGKGEEVHGPPSTFELLTLLAFCAFQEARCEVVVVETGIGGRLDATNVVVPELSVITPIELEHTDVLGDTLRAIAAEKAGIIKPGVPVISAAQASEAEKVLRAVARERGSPITFVGEELTLGAVSSSPSGTRLRLVSRQGEERELRLALLGTHQAENGALAYLGLRRLGISPAAIEAGFAVAVLPARMELLRAEPPVVLDGAHTPRSVGRVLESFLALFGPQGEAVLLFAAAAGKRVAEMAAILAPAFSVIVVTGTGSLRESAPAEVHRAFGALNPGAELVPDPGQALERALGHAGGRLPLLITGSFYLAGEVRQAWERREDEVGGDRGLQGGASAPSSRGG
jgi:dihydrofolate synthase/folylpolyglutamate synthase